MTSSPSTTTSTSVESDISISSTGTLRLTDHLLQLSQASTPLSTAAAFPSTSPANVKAYSDDAFVASYARATETHPFLLAASSKTLSHECLGLWLAQDRVYAGCGYPKFIGTLVSNIPFNSSSNGWDSPEEILNSLILRILTFCLDNIQKEVIFFKNVVEEYALASVGKERKATRDYLAEMRNVSTSGGMEDGLVFLWAMEKVRRLKSE
jgi:hypothetical protein